MTLEEFNNNTFEQNIQYFLENSDNIVTANYLHNFASEELEKGHDDIVINILSGLDESFKYYYIDWLDNEYLPIPLCQNADLRCRAEGIIELSSTDKEKIAVSKYIRNCLDIDSQVNLFNNWCRTTNNYRLQIYFYNEFDTIIDNEFKSLKPSEIANHLRFCNLDDYIFIFDDKNDNVISYDYSQSAREDMDLLDYLRIDTLTDYIVNNNNVLGCEVLTKVMQEADND